MKAKTKEEEPGWPLQNTPPVAGSKYPTPYGRPIEKTTRG